jgi:hypothetical protein
MIRAALISLGSARAPAAASQEHVPIACAFTLVCAPEIECEAHEGIPFEIGHSGGVHRLEIDGSGRGRASC